MAGKKHKVRTLMTSPLGLPGQVIEVDDSTPNVDRWLTLGVLEYVSTDDEGEADGAQGDADFGPLGAGEGEPGGEPEDDQPTG